MKEEKKRRITFKRVCDDLLIGFDVGYVVLAIVLRVLGAMKVIEYNYFQPPMVIAGIILFILGVIRYRIEKARESQH